MKELSVKKIIGCCIAFGSALFTLIALAFPLLSIYGSGINGFDTLSLMSASGAGWWVILCGVLALFQLLASCAMMILCVIALFLFGQKRAKQTALASIIIGIVFNALYMVEGIIISAVGEVDTVAYVAFILNVLFTVAYFVCNGVVKDKMLLRNSTKTEVGKTEKNVQQYSYDEGKVIELLAKYKTLLDEGVITQEEYAKKKRELLGQVMGD